jgi:DNA-binding NtrC family response regulator
MEAPAVRAVIIDLQGLDQASALQVVQAVRKEKASLQVVALTCLPRAEVGDKLFREAGFSYAISKPLRHSTIATVLLQALGVQLQTSTKRKSPDSQLLSGKRLLVVRPACLTMHDLASSFLEETSCQ